MASELINCLQVQSFSAQENAGDRTYIYNPPNLEVQSSVPLDSNGQEITVHKPSTGETLPLSQWSGSGGVAWPPQPGTYYLVVEPLPGYSIVPQELNIAGIPAGCDSVGDSWVWYNGFQMILCGSDPQELQPMPILPSEVSYVAAFPTKELGTCGCGVVLMVTLDPQFIMPPNDKTISLDLGGTATECEEPSLAGMKVINHQLLINAPAWEQVGSDLAQHGNFEIYTARYFPSAEYAESPYLVCNNLYYGEATWFEQMTVMKPTYDFLGVCPSDKYTDGSFNSFQPEVFDRYKMFIDSPMWFDTDNTYANVTTTCGELSSQWGGLDGSTGYWGAENYDISSGGSIPSSHPHQDLIEGGWNRGYNYGYQFQPYTSVANASDYYYGIDTTVTPITEPGDGILPPLLAWYISVGDNPNYNLIASPETVDVWKIVSYDTNNVGNTFQQIEDQQGCPMSQLGPPNNPANTFFGKSEKDVNGNTISNDSNFNINLVDLQQIDDKTIRLAIPWNADVQYDLTPQEFKTWHNKIFINIYPSEV